MKKVLIVDDSPTMRSIMARVLRQADLDVDEILEAGSGAEGLAKLRAHHDIGLVLSDVNMPVMDGNEFVHAIRATHPKASLPVILITTESAAKAIECGPASGANGLVCKPFTPESIRTALEPYLG